MADIRVLTAGAFKPVLTALVPEFERRTGHRVSADNGTVGELIARIDGGEAFDALVLNRRAIQDCVRAGRIVAGTAVALAKVGVGVMVKAGAPRPEIGTVEAFKQALLDARSVAYLDPASGGSSGAYVAGLLERLCIADRVAPKVRLQRGGHVSDLVVSGDAEIGIHQISAIVREPKVTLVGPLPAPIQNFTTYVAGLGSAANDAAAAEAFIALLAGPVAAAVLGPKGMEAA